MQDTQSINKARAIYYNLFANFFVPSSDIKNYFELFRLLNLLKDSSLDEASEESIKNIYEEKNNGLGLLFKNFTNYFTLNYNIS